MRGAVEIERFRALTVQGRKYMIVVYQDQMGLSRYYTSTGLSVKPIDQQTFQIVLTDEIVKRERENVNKQ